VCKHALEQERVVAGEAALQRFAQRRELLAQNLPLASSESASGSCSPEISARIIWRSESSIISLAT
jgi:hypothetical protein